MENTDKILLDRFPLGVQSFEDLRNRNCYYVDKTDYEYRLAILCCNFSDNSAVTENFGRNF